MRVLNAVGKSLVRQVALGGLVAATLIFFVASPAGASPTPGQDGFEVLNSKSRDRGSYTLRLISNSQGNVEALRGAVQTAVNEIAAVSGVQIYVAPGTLPDTSPDREPGPREIFLSIDATSDVCSGGWWGCGSPRTYEALNSREYIRSSRIWINPELMGRSASDQLHTVAHELGHALGLAHYQQIYNGEYQLMATGQWAATTFRSGDRNGLLYMFPPLAPSVETAGSTGIVADSAKLYGFVNPNDRDTTYQFQYGTTTNYGSVTPETAAGGDLQTLEVSTSIGGLAEGTTYHYRLVAKNSSGQSYGTDRSFTTAALPDAGTWAVRSPSTNPNAPIWTFFRGSGGKLTQLWWDGSIWQKNEEMNGFVSAGTSPAVTRVRSTDPNAPIWVFYRNASGKLAQTRWNGSKWSTEDMGYSVAEGTSPTVLRTASSDANAPIWVFFQSTDNKLQWIKWNGSKWDFVDLGFPAMAPKSSPAATLVSTSDAYAAKWVFYRGANGNLIQVKGGDTWVPTDRGVKISAETSPSVTRLATLDANSPIAVFYSGPNNKLTETWWNEKEWKTEPVGDEVAAGSSPVAVRTPSANANAPIWVYYRGANGKLTQTWWNEKKWSTETKGTEQMFAGATPVALRPPSLSANASIFTFYRNTESFATQTWWNESAWTTKPFATKME